MLGGAALKAGCFLVRSSFTGKYEESGLSNKNKNAAFKADCVLVRSSFTCKVEKKWFWEK